MPYFTNTNRKIRQTSNSQALIQEEIHNLDDESLRNLPEGLDGANTSLPRNIFLPATTATSWKIQKRGDNKHAVFLVTESEALSYYYELPLPKQPAAEVSPDPRISNTLNLRFDDYGRALQTVAVVYPRQVP